MPSSHLPGADHGATADRLVAAGAEGSGRSIVGSIVREVEVLRFRLSLSDWVVDYRFRRARPCGDGGAGAVCQKNLAL